MHRIEEARHRLVLNLLSAACCLATGLDGTSHLHAGFRMARKGGDATNARLGTYATACLTEYPIFLPLPFL